jgi:hypothetical protein
MHDAHYTYGDLPGILMFVGELEFFGTFMWFMYVGIVSIRVMWGRGLRGCQLKQGYIVLWDLETPKSKSIPVPSTPLILSN